MNSMLVELHRRGLTQVKARGSGVKITAVPIGRGQKQKARDPTFGDELQPSSIAGLRDKSPRPDFRTSAPSRDPRGSERESIHSSPRSYLFSPSRGKRP